MSAASRPEPWLRGPLPGIDPILMPAAHALVQATEDLERTTPGLKASELWARPGGAAAVGFHLRHIAGSIGRLLTYARGAELDEAHHAALAGEADPPRTDETAEALTAAAVAAIGDVLEAMRRTPAPGLFEARAVGRRRLPSSVFGLLVHIAEHTQRHIGQIVTTAKIVRAASL